MAAVGVLWTLVQYHLGTNRGVTLTTNSLFKKGESRVPKKTKDDPIYTSKRGNKEMTERALIRDSERRKQEKGSRSSPLNKQDLNLTVEERG